MPETPGQPSRPDRPRGSITVHPLANQADVIPGIPVDQEAIRQLEASFELLRPVGETVTRNFYRTLFELHPEYRGMFSTDLAVQQKKLLATLVAVIEGLKQPGALREKMRELGRLHVEKGVRNEQYPVVCDILLRCMRDAAGARWTAVYDREWQRALGQISELMTSAPSVRV